MKRSITGWKPDMKRPYVRRDGEGWRVTWPRGDSFWWKTEEQAKQCVADWQEVVKRGREKA